jgi:molybdopterin/thiamine biosynthesis adenylyltransferase
VLTTAERDRYQRQIMMDGFGEVGQEKLKQAKVFIAGAGGLGSPVAIYLAVAGVGQIRIVDRDVVELSNLNRQILHWDKDVDRGKAESAGEKLRQMNSDIKIEVIAENLTEDNILELIGDCQLIVDAMDNFPTRYLLNKAALSRNMPFFHGSVHGLDGMATTIIPGETACLRCIFPEPPPAAIFPVIGVTPGIIGCIQATEVIKHIVGIGELLKNRLLVWDGTITHFGELIVKKDPQCRDCGSLT